MPDTIQMKSKRVSLKRIENKLRFTLGKLRAKLFSFKNSLIALGKRKKKKKFGKSKNYLLLFQVKPRKTTFETQFLRGVIVKLDFITTIL